ncbi:hypothetical protein N656DRAFT_354062 [Canariomyces notabilis]|uniref:Uncharacterized protein n=1 Tax=Canariomyces notabilis TaxID=2074819 RepID=A0AAN6QLP7_9PEZI|nr:hypothetical protein N656DRAFT_354062 [Canariomyces arenarius]
MEDQTAALIIVTGIIDRRQWLAVGPEVGDTKSYNGPFCFLAKSFRSLRISVFHTVEPNPNSEDDDAIINLPDIRQRSVDLLHFVDRKHRRRDKITPSAANTAGKLDDLASDSAPPVLIFAGHDLGGIVVKQALLTANSKARFDWIVSACISVVFVETPHYAPDLHAWERTILRMLGLVEGSFDFVSFFKYLPAFASRVEEDFQDAFESLPVINFYTKASPLYNVRTSTRSPAFLAFLAFRIHL